jgi:hypothetical protein
VAEWLTLILDTGVEHPEATLGRTRKRPTISHEARLEKRKVILAALTKVSSEKPPADPPPADNAANDYYTLSHEEMEALVSGNLAKIESWVSNLDQRHATWLLRWLIKEGL